MFFNILILKQLYSESILGEKSKTIGVEALEPLHCMRTNILKDDFLIMQSEKISYRLVWCQKTI